METFRLGPDLVFQRQENRQKTSESLTSDEDTNHTSTTSLNEQLNQPISSTDSSIKQIEMKYGVAVSIKDIKGLSYVILEDKKKKRHIVPTPEPEASHLTQSDSNVLKQENRIEDREIDDVTTSLLRRPTYQLDNSIELSNITSEDVKKISRKGPKVNRRSCHGDLISNKDEETKRSRSLSPNKAMEFRKKNRSRSMSPPSQKVTSSYTRVDEHRTRPVSNLIGFFEHRDDMVTSQMPKKRRHHPQKSKPTEKTNKQPSTPITKLNKPSNGGLVVTDAPSNQSKKEDFEICLPKTSSVDLKSEDTKDQTLPEEDEDSAEDQMIPKVISPSKQIIEKIRSSSLADDSEIIDLSTSSTRSSDLGCKTSMSESRGRSPIRRSEDVAPRRRSTSIKFLHINSRETSSDASKDQGSLVEELRDQIRSLEEEVSQLKKDQDEDQKMRDQKVKDQDEDQKMKDQKMKDQEVKDEDQERFEDLENEVKKFEVLLQEEKVFHEQESDQLRKIIDDVTTDKMSKLARKNEEIKKLHQMQEEERSSNDAQLEAVKKMYEDKIARLQQQQKDRSSDVDLETNQKILQLEKQLQMTRDENVDLQRHVKSRSDEEELKEEKRKLEKLILELKSERSTIEMQMYEMREERDNEHRNLRNLEVHWSRGKNRISELEQQIEKQKKEAERYRRQVEAQVSDLERLVAVGEERLRSSQAERIAIEQRLNEVKLNRVESEDASDVRKKLEERVEDAETRLNAIQKELEGKSAAVRSLNRSNCRLQEELRKMDVELEEELKEREALNADKLQSSRDLQQVERKLVEAIEERQKAIREVSKLRDQIHDQNQMQKDLEESRCRCETLCNHVERVKRDLQRSEFERQMLARQLEDEQAVSKSEKQVSTCSNSDVIEARRALQKMKIDLEIKNDSEKDLRCKLDESEKKMIKITEDRDRMQEEVKRLEKESKMLMKDVEVKRDLLKKSQIRISDLEDWVDEVQKRSLSRADLRHKAVDSDDDVIAGLRREVGDLKLALKDQEEKSLKDQEEMKKNLDEKKIEVEDAYKRIYKLRDEIVRMQKSDAFNVDGAAEEQSHLQDQILELKDQLDDVEDEKIRLKEDLKMKTQKLEDAENTITQQEDKIKMFSSLDNKDHMTKTRLNDQQKTDEDQILLLEEIKDLKDQLMKMKKIKDGRLLKDKSEEDEDERLRSEIEYLESRILDVEEDREELKEQIKSLKEQTEELSDEILFEQNRCDKLMSEKKELQNKLSASIRYGEEQHNKVAPLEERLMRQNSQLNEIGSRHKNTEIKIKEIVAEAEKDIKNSNLEKEKMSFKLRSLSEQLISSEKRRSEAEEDLKMMQNEMKKIKDENLELQENLQNSTKTKFSTNSNLFTSV